MTPTAPRRRRTKRIVEKVVTFPTEHTYISPVPHIIHEGYLQVEGTSANRAAPFDDGSGAGTGSSGGGGSAPSGGGALAAPTGLAIDWNGLDCQGIKNLIGSGTLSAQDLAVAQDQMIAKGCSSGNAGNPQLPERPPFETMSCSQLKNWLDKNSGSEFYSDAINVAGINGCLNTSGGGGSPTPESGGGGGLVPMPVDPSPPVRGNDVYTEPTGGGGTGSAPAPTGGGSATTTTQTTNNTPFVFPLGFGKPPSDGGAGGGGDKTKKFPWWIVIVGGVILVAFMMNKKKPAA
jgi:hypothetical protein